jgi:hypothetical protein
VLRGFGASHRVAAFGGSRPYTRLRNPMATKVKKLASNSKVLRNINSKR